MATRANKSKRETAAAPKPSPDWPAVEQKPKSPTAAQVAEMGKRFRQHRDNVQALLADVQAIVESRWPIADPDYEGNLVDQLVPLTKPIDYITGGDDVVEVDMTLAALLADLDTIAEDLSPGPEQGQWAKDLATSAGKPANK